MKVIKAPQALEIEGKSVFLAGSIEMGKAVDWQTMVTNALGEMAYQFTVLNPRRDDWDSSWEQKITNPQFKEQVTWELDALEKADYVIMYFDPKTMSPISLLELGLYARHRKLLVVCPDGFWRKGNVDVVCEKYECQQFDTLEKVVEMLKIQLQPDPEPVAKNAYFKKEGTCVGIHAWGHEFEGVFYQEEIWGNEYDDRGQMVGRGSFRVFDSFENECANWLADGWTQYEAP